MPARVLRVQLALLESEVLQLEQVLLAQAQVQVALVLRADRQRSPPSYRAIGQMML